MHDYYAASSDYQRWADQRRSDPLLIEDAKKVSRRIQQRASEWQPEEQPPAQSRRGRPKLNTPNPAARFMPLLSFNRPQWVDDIVYGAVATAAGTHKGRLNVRPGYVLAALHMGNVSAEGVKTQDMPTRTAQVIAQAARHAAHGIASHLDRHPKIKHRLESELEFE